MTAGQQNHVPIVTIELDGVLADSNQALARIAGTTAEPMSQEEAERARALAAETPSFWLDVEPYCDVDRSTLNRATDDGFLTPYYLGSRFNCTVRDTPAAMNSATQQSMRWLHWNELPMYGGVFADVTDLVEAVDILGSHLHVTADLNMFQAMKAAGRDVVLWTRPWNASLDTMDRVDSMGDLLKLIGVPDNYAVPESVY